MKIIKALNLKDVAKKRDKLISCLEKEKKDKNPKQQEDLIDWIEIRVNATKAGIIGGEENASDGSKSILGGTKKDLEYLGIKLEERFSLKKELDKHGGKLDATKLFELTG